MAVQRDDDWLGLYDGVLPVDEAIQWATRDNTGATVAFTGTARDHSEEREGVTALSYEAWEEQVEPVLREVVAEARVKWPDLVRTVVLHRTGDLVLREAAVLVVAAAPHRAEAFEAARYLIDETKARAPIWKKEVWVGGEDWSAPAACESVGGT